MTSTRKSEMETLLKMFTEKSELHEANANEIITLQDNIDRLKEEHNTYEAEIKELSQKWETTHHDYKQLSKLDMSMEGLKKEVTNDHKSHIELLKEFKKETGFDNPQALKEALEKTDNLEQGSRKLDIKKINQSKTPDEILAHLDTKKVQSLVTAIDQVLKSIDDNEKKYQEYEVAKHNTLKKYQANNPEKIKNLAKNYKTNIEKLETGLTNITNMKNTAEQSIAKLTKEQTLHEAVMIELNKKIVSLKQNKNQDSSPTPDPTPSKRNSM